MKWLELAGDCWNLLELAEDGWVGLEFAEDYNTYMRKRSALKKDNLYRELCTE
ncbi:MAG: hypothetical protein K9K78_05650 [Spirochaetales bacterium]|nr:hypothetical protein [Spirochaetales bacterium]